jgi:hypothetical protein
MIRNIIVLTGLLLILTTGFSSAQAFIKTSDLFERSGAVGKLTIIQDSAVDTLISRYIISKNKIRTREGNQGIWGVRIQIYYSSVRAAREESAKIRADFISKFPDIVSYAEYEEPGWFMVRVGDYRTRAEGYKDLLMIRKGFPNAYLVPSVINYPDLIKK